MSENSTSISNTIAQTEQLVTRAEQQYQAGDFDAARTTYQHVLLIQRQILPENHLAIARTLQGLSLALLELGDYTAARRALEEALSIREAALGAEHPDVAQCISTFGVVRFFQQDVVTAQQLTEQALQLREQVLGDIHPDTIETLNNLGTMVNARGDRARSRALHELALERCERGVGDTHYVTAGVLSSLALRTDSPEQARVLGERSLTLCERLLGPTHPYTTRAMNNLAVVFLDLKDPISARSLLDRSLTLNEQQFGSQSPRVAYMLHNLAGVYKQTGDLDAARRCYERALIIREHALGARHPDTMASLKTLVSFLGNRIKEGDEDAKRTSMPLYVCMTALQAAAGTLDPKNANMPGAHLDVERAIKQLHEVVERIDETHKRPPLSAEQQAQLSHAAALQTQADERTSAGDYVSTRDLLEQSITIIEQVHGTAHMSLVQPLRKLQEIMTKLDKPTAVLPLVQRIVDIHVAALGEHHSQTQSAMSDFAGIYSREYGFAAALPLYEHKAKIMEEAFGANNPHVQNVRRKVERWHTKYGDVSTAATTPPISRSERHEAAVAQQPIWVEEVLTGIDAIDWHALHHAYGAADDVPKLLRLLGSDDPDVRDETLNHLYSNIWHQGTVYEASAYVVPFLLRLLADKRTPDPVSIIGLLEALATGNSYLAVHHHDDDSSGMDWRELLAKKGQDFDTQLQRELDHVQAANEAVAAGAEMFMTLFEDASQITNMRREALQTLSSLPTHAEIIVPRLQMMLEHADATEFHADTVHALHQLMDETPRSQRFFADVMQRAINANSAFYAAIALIARTRERAPETAVAIVTDVRGHGGEVGYGYWRFHTVAALLQLGPKRAIPAVLKTLPLVREPEATLEIAQRLLASAFNNGQIIGRHRASSRNRQTGKHNIKFWGGKGKELPAREAATLNDEQRRVLVAIVAHDPLWEEDSNLLSLYGMPNEREELRAWLA